jgi:hypothetical protein
MVIPGGDQDVRVSRRDLEIIHEPVEGLIDNESNPSIVFELDSSIRLLRPGLHFAGSATAVII